MKFPRDKYYICMKSMFDDGKESVKMHVYCFMFSEEYLSACIHFNTLMCWGKNVCHLKNFVDFWLDFYAFEWTFMFLREFVDVNELLWMRSEFYWILVFTEFSKFKLFEMFLYFHYPCNLFTKKNLIREIKLEFNKSSAPWHIKNHFNGKNIKRNCQFKDCSWDLLAINYELR